MSLSDKIVYVETGSIQQQLLDTDPEVICTKDVCEAVKKLKEIIPHHKINTIECSEDKEFNRGLEIVGNKIDEIFGEKLAGLTIREVN